MKVTDYHSFYVMRKDYRRTMPPMIDFFSEEWDKEPRGRLRDLELGTYLPPYTLRFLYQNK